MEKRIAPSAVKAQELRAMVQGQSDVQSGEEMLSLLVRLSTERVLQEALEHEPAEALGRGRYEPRGEGQGDRKGYENGTLKTAEGVLRVQSPQSRGREEPYRSPVWSPMASTRDGLTPLLVERSGGGMSQRDIADSWEKAVGQFVLSKSTGRELTDTLTAEYEAVRTRALSAEPVAYLFIDAV